MRFGGAPGLPGAPPRECPSALSVFVFHFPRVPADARPRAPSIQMNHDRRDCGGSNRRQHMTALLATLLLATSTNIQISAEVVRSSSISVSQVDSRGGRI